MYLQGVDVGNVDNVYVWGAPEHLEGYMQQTGRAGRRGQEGHAVLMAEKTVYPVRSACPPVQSVSNGDGDDEDPESIFRKECDENVREFILAGTDFGVENTCRCQILDD